MSDRFFLDTNVLAYAFDVAAPLKAKISDELVRRAITTGKGLISYQVVQEFFNVAFRKFPVPMPRAEAHAYFISVLRPLLAIMFSPALVWHALDVREKYSITWYDSLIVAAAMEADCAILYSEDFQHKGEIGGVKIINPFA